MEINNSISLNSKNIERKKLNKSLIKIRNEKNLLKEKEKERENEEK